MAKRNLGFRYRLAE